MNAAPVPSDEEFKAAFSLLPKVLNLLKKLSSAQGDHQKQIQTAVRLSMGRGALTSMSA